MEKKFDRRSFLKITGMTALAAGLSISLRRRLLEDNQLGIYRNTRLLMGTPVTLQLVAEDHELASASVESAFREMTRWIHLMDYRQGTSPLAELNRTGTLTQSPPELIEVLEAAAAFSRLTSGALDVTIKPALDEYRLHKRTSIKTRKLVDYRGIQIQERDITLLRAGMEITLDGIAKGWIVDKTALYLSDLGFDNLLVEAGGDLQLSGTKTNTAAWKVGIQHPRGGLCMVIEGDDRAAATSGDYQHTFDEQFIHHHILNPRTGSSPRILSSATVIARQAVQADALSTALMVLGVERGLDVIEQIPDAEALLITKKMDLISSSDFPKPIT